MGNSKYKSRKYWVWHKFDYEKCNYDGLVKRQQMAIKKPVVSFRRNCPVQVLEVYSQSLQEDTLNYWL
jgi:hypothetical protein